MRYFCLTSIDVEEHVPPNNPWDTIFNISRDPDAMEERICRFKEYVFTEIQIGFLPGTKTYMFVIHRHTGPDPYYYIAMKPGVLAVLESENHFIDITINISTEEDQRNFFRENVKPTKTRIRNIKNTIVKGIRNEDHKNYQAYLKTIKNYCAENPGRSVEDAFDKNEMPASLISGAEKSLTNKVAEIQKAISDLCDSIVNISDSARYNKPLDTIFFGCTDTNICIKNKEEYNDKIRDNKLKWAYLNFESKFSEFEKGWFDAVNIFGLELRNVTISNESQNIWQNFAEGIQKMEKLILFTLSANLKEIPSIVFQYFPISITHLDFNDNNLTSIPSEINRLINLQSLSLTNNKMLTENGIPWKNLPTTLKSLYLNNTGITEIPKNIAHLTSLLYLYLKDTKLEKVTWTSLNKNLKSLEIEFAENFDGIIELPDLENLEMRNIVYQSINFEKLPVTLTFLNLYNCKIDGFRSISNLLNLKSLHLSKNKMTSIPWEYFPESLRILNLSHNEIEDKEKIGSMKFWIKLTKLDLSYNKVKMFEYYFDEDAYDEIDPLIDYKKKGIFLNLYHNELESLPYGFENFIPLAGINIGHNSFNTANLNDALWKRLPSNGLLKCLCLNENKLNSLPCLLKNFPLEELEAVDCNLYYICPQIPRKLEDKDYISNISKNTNLERLPFIPKIVLPPPPIGACAESEYPKPSTLDLNRAIHEPKYSIKIITDSSKFRCPQSQKRQKQLSFTFKEKNNVKNIKYFCKCCARCGEIVDEKIIEQVITMDCKLCKTKRDEKIWKPGAWKSCVNTRLCEDCKSWYKNETEKITVSLEVENEREKEENSKKMKSIFDDEAEEMELMEVTNYEGNNSLQFIPQNDDALPSITDLYSNGIDFNNDNNFVVPDCTISQKCYYPTTLPRNPSGPGPSYDVTPVQQQFITQEYYQPQPPQSYISGPVEPIQSTSNIYYQLPQQQQFPYSDISSTLFNQHQTYDIPENDFIPQFHYLNNMQDIETENVVGFENSQAQQQPPINMETNSATNYYNSNYYNENNKYQN